MIDDGFVSLFQNYLLSRQIITVRLLEACQFEEILPIKNCLGFPRGSHFVVVYCLYASSRGQFTEKVAILCSQGTF